MVTMSGGRLGALGKSGILPCRRDGIVSKLTRRLEMTGRVRKHQRRRDSPSSIQREFIRRAPLLPEAVLMALLFRVSPTAPARGGPTRESTPPPASEPRRYSA